MSAASGNLVVGLAFLVLGIGLLSMSSAVVALMFGWLSIIYSVYRLVAVVMCVLDIQEKNMQLEAQQAACLVSISRALGSISKDVDSLLHETSNEAKRNKTDE